MANLEPNELSERELDILKLVATGASNKEIAQKLFISSNTVKVHLRNIFAKINATSRTEAAMFAVRTGLVENASPQIGDREDGYVKDDYAGAGGEISQALPVEQKRFSQRMIVSSVIIIGSLIVLIILGVRYLPGNIFQINTPIPPTPTQRVQWFELPGLPTPRQGLAVVGYENLLYSIGGETNEGISNQVERYDPKTNQWIELAPKPISVTDINAALIGGLIYVPGGRLASGEPTEVTEVFDPLANRWSIGTPLPGALSGYSLAVYEGKIYVFGGWDGTQVVGSVFVFTPHDGTWSEIAQMPTARSYSGAVVVAGKIVIIGGWDGSQALSACEVFRPDVDNPQQQWTNCSPLPTGRYGMGVTNLADMVFVIGGTNSADDLTTIVLMQGENTWSKLDSPVAQGWYYLNTATIGSRLYALGGVTEDGLVKPMWSYQAIYTVTLPIIR